MAITDSTCRDRMDNVDKRLNMSDKKLDYTKESLDRLLGSVSMAKWMIGIGLPLFGTMIVLIMTLQIKGLENSIRRNEIRPINRSAGMIDMSEDKLRKTRANTIAYHKRLSRELSNRNNETKASDPERN